MYNPKVKLSSGNPAAVAYVNTGAANAAGDVVVTNGILYFVQTDLAQNQQGAAAFSGGVWAGNKASGAWTAGQPVYWNPTGNPNVGTAGTGAFTQTYNAAYSFAGVATITPGTTAAALTADQVGFFVKVNGSAGGLKVVGGKFTTVTASDTLATSLNYVVAAVANTDALPVAGAELITATPGDQAVAPVAGSILISSWKTLGGTPVAGTTFGQVVDWIAYGY